MSKKGTTKDKVEAFVGLLDGAVERAAIGMLHNSSPMGIAADAVRAYAYIYHDYVYGDESEGGHISINPDDPDTFFVKAGTVSIDDIVPESRDRTEKRIDGEFSELIVMDPTVHHVMTMFYREEVAMHTALKMAIVEIVKHRNQLLDKLVDIHTSTSHQRLST